MSIPHALHSLTRFFSPHRRLLQDAHNNEILIVATSRIFTSTHLDSVCKATLISLISSQITQIQTSPSPSPSSTLNLSVLLAMHSILTGTTSVPSELKYIARTTALEELDRLLKYKSEAEVEEFARRRVYQLCKDGQEGSTKHECYTILADTAARYRDESIVGRYREAYGERDFRDAINGRDVIRQDLIFDPRWGFSGGLARQS